MWLIAVKNRDSFLPERITPTALAKHTNIRVGSVLKYLREMADLGLIGFTRANQIVVRGVRANHMKIEWKRDEPVVQRAGDRYVGKEVWHTELINPWAEDPNYQWNPAGTTQPAKRRRGSSKKPVKTPRKPVQELMPNVDPAVDPLAQYGYISKHYDEIVTLLKGVCPAAHRHHNDAQARDTLAKLVKLDEYTEQDVAGTLQWVFSSDHEDAVFWRTRGIASIGGPLRTKTKAGITKFATMHMRWKAAKADGVAPMSPAEREQYLKKRGLWYG